MGVNDFTHIAFADETNYSGSERFGAISLLSMERSIGKRLNSDLSEIIKENNVNELKWNEVGNSNKYSVVADKFLKRAFDSILAKEMRVDVICWDNQDSRHDIQGRDDIANFHRMIHHLLKYTLTQRWPDKLSWAFFPDENTAVRWDEVQYFLDLKDYLTIKELDIFSAGKPYFRNVYNIVCINELSSEEYPIIQLADLFVGMQVFSRNRYEGYKQWGNLNNNQQSLFKNDPTKIIELSKRDIKRFPILQRFKQRCSDCSLGVSLNSFGGLRTKDPKNPINFWWFNSQHGKDKAPLRKKIVI